MAHHSDHHAAPSVASTPRMALSSSFWFVLILAGLFIAAVNFVKVTKESHDDHGAHSEAPAGTHGDSGHGGHH